MWVPDLHFTDKEIGKQGLWEPSQKELPGKLVQRQDCKPVHFFCSHCWECIYMTQSNGTFRVLTYDQKRSHHGLDLQKLIEKVPVSNQQEASKFRQRCVGRTSALCTTVNSATGRGQEAEACLPSLFFPTCNWRWLTCSKCTSKNQILLIINCLKIWDQINSVTYLTEKKKKSWDDTLYVDLNNTTEAFICKCV